MIPNDNSNKQIAAGLALTLGASFIAVKTVKYSGHIISSLQALSKMSTSSLIFSLGTVIGTSMLVEKGVRQFLEKIPQVRDSCYMHLASTFAGLTAGTAAASILVKIAIIPASLTTSWLLVAIGGTTFVVYKLMTMEKGIQLQEGELPAQAPTIDIVERKKQFQEAIEQNPLAVIKAPLVAMVRALFPSDQRHANELAEMLENGKAEINQFIQSFLPQEKVPKNTNLQTDDAAQANNQPSASRNILKKMVNTYINSDPLAQAFLNLVLSNNQPHFDFLGQNVKDFIQEERSYLSALETREQGQPAPEKPNNFVSGLLNTSVKRILDQRAAYQETKEPIVPYLNNVLKYKNSIGWGLTFLNIFRHLMIFARVGEFAVKAPIYALLFGLKQAGYINQEQYELCKKLTPVLAKLLVVIGPQILDLHHWNDYIKHYEEIDAIIKGEKDLKWVNDQGEETTIPPKPELVRAMLVEFYSKIVDDLTGPEHIVKALDAAVNSLSTIHA